MRYDHVMHYGRGHTAIMGTAFAALRTRFRTTFYSHVRRLILCKRFSQQDPAAARAKVRLVVLRASVDEFPHHSAGAAPRPVAVLSPNAHILSRHARRQLLVCPCHVHRFSFLQSTSRRTRQSSGRRSVAADFCVRRLQVRHHQGRQGSPSSSAGRRGPRLAQRPTPCAIQARCCHC